MVLEIAQPSPEFDPNATPQDGKQFLIRMYYERERCPAIVQCPLPDSTLSSPAVQSTQLPTDDEAQLMPNMFLTTPEWINAQTCTFLKARSKVTLLRMNKSIYSSKLEDQPGTLPTQGDEEIDWQNFCVANEPSLSLILQFGQRQLELLLEYLSKWLNTAATEVEENVFCDLLGSKRWLGIWIYATLVCLELPLEPQVHSTLREIARSYIIFRSRLKSDEEQKAQQYNVFIAIIGCVFAQYDFKEYL